MTKKDKIALMDFQGNDNIGLFSYATDSVCIVGRNIAKKKDVQTIKDILGVEVIELDLLGTQFVGIFVSGNSNGLIISSRLYEREKESMKEKFNTLILDTKYTAIGNMILANDKGAVISEELERYRKKISDFLKVPVLTGTISGISLVGSLGICNNKGCLVHKDIKEKEKKLLEKVLGVPVDTGSVNFGSSWMRTGIIANSNGFIAGKETSGPELGNISEALGFV